MRICIACSAGGHLSEARRMERVYAKYEHFYVTFSSAVASDLGRCRRVHVVPNLYRRHVLSWVRTALASARVMWREKPDVVITTDAGVVFFVCLFAKLRGARIIFLESIANTERPTATGRILYPITDLFIVSWPALLAYYPKAKCICTLV